MAFDGNGNWVSIFFPTQDRDNDIPISASKFEAQIQTNQKASFENCATIDSQTKLISNWDFNVKKGINLTAGTNATDAVNFTQLEGRADLSLSNLIAAASATESKAGVTQLANDQDMVNLTNDTKSVTPLKVGKLISDKNLYMPGFIKDFIPTFVDVDNISCAGGDARDADNSLNISDTVTITKDKSLTWALGTGGGTAEGVSIGNDETFHMFTIAGGIAAATSGEFITDNITSNLTNFQSVTDGYLSYRVDNGLIEIIENLDFSLVLSIGDIATLINNRIANADVTESGGVITFTSLTQGENSSVQLFGLSQTGTDIYGASYLDGDNGQAVQGESEQAGQVDYGYDTDVDATNLLADTAIVAAGFNKYRRISSFLTNATGETYEFNVNNNAGELYIEYKTKKIVFSEASPTAVSDVSIDAFAPNGITTEIRIGGKGDVTGSGDMRCSYGSIYQDLENTPSSLYDIDAVTGSNVSISKKEVSSTNGQIKYSIFVRTGTTNFALTSAGYKDYRN